MQETRLYEGAILADGGRERHSMGRDEYRKNTTR